LRLQRQRTRRGEEAAHHPSLLHAGQIEMTDIVTVQEGALGRRLGMDEAEEDIVVTVEDGNLG